MLYVNLLDASFNLTLTLGDADTESPPPLLLSLVRKGTNFTASQVLPTAGIETGARFVTYVAIPTDLFLDPTAVRQSGQYDYFIYDNTNPGTPVLIEKGLLIALTTPITKTEYGTDKERGEYKDHI